MTIKFLDGTVLTHTAGAINRTGAGTAIPGIARADPQHRSRLIETRFGDGYVHRQPDGLNHIERTWAVRWPTMGKEPRDCLLAFFEEHGDYKPFLFSHPIDGGNVRVVSVAGTWRGPKVDETATRLYTFNVTLRQDFGYG